MERDRHGHSRRARTVSRVLRGLALLLVAVAVLIALDSTATAAPAPPDPIDVPLPPNIPLAEFEPATPTAPSATPLVPPSGSPFTTTGEDDGDSGQATIGLQLPDVTGDSSNAVVVILLLSVLSVAPSLLILTTSFTRIVIVLSLTRNAVGIPSLPPQQVIVGLSLFLTLFVMGPTLSEMNEAALQPLLGGELSFTEAADAASIPLRSFMLETTREPELKMFLNAADAQVPIARDEVPLNALIPAFVLSELKSAFILGFVIFIPFMVIDIVVSAVLTSLGMMMLPPTFVSLPVKLLLFILLDGWTLVVGTVLSSYG